MAPRRFLLAAAGGAGLLALIYALAGSAVIAFAASRMLTVGLLLEAFEPDERPSDPLVLGYRGDPGEAFGLAFETVEITTPLGPAPAWWVPAPESGADDALSGLAAVYVHGVAGAREDGYRHLSLLHARGIPVLLITYRNDLGAPPAPHGRYAFGMEEWEDLEAAILWLEGEGHDRLILAGESMGGAIAGQFLIHSTHAGHIVGLALDSPALDFTPVLVRVGEAIGLPGAGLLAPPARLLLSLTGPTDFSRTTLIDDIAGFDRPFFLAHGQTDSAVPYAISARLAARRTGPMVFITTQADHLQSFAEDPDRYRSAFNAFLDTAAQDLTQAQDGAP
ncbi:alpha/beta fold hydrolase [Alkalicaulis satelles]|uniref:Alpha/beta fold hydrolase n=1 Tax=Alkalicaulis satelles TaxID=2609175 RepID=A0A5M6ZGL5_9PROT|nr:alpha/beta fold hydrolase [Alkalicaulis satelles]KAA5803906.1 alpha/beta fold hydrolase [Alkalicaulis satelles]